MLRRNHFLVLVTILAVGVLLVSTVTKVFLFNSALDGERARLLDSAAGYARLIEEEVRHHGGEGSTTLAVLRRAHQRYNQTSGTSEFLLGEVRDDRIRYLLPRRFQSPAESPRYTNGRAEPMQRALQGKTGTMIGRDYRGTQVVAAFTPVSGTGWGLVTKIDLAELAAPYIRQGLLSALAALAVIVGGAALFRWAVRPFLAQAEALAQQREELFEKLGVGVVAFDPNGVVRHINHRARRIFGCPDELSPEQPVAALLPGIQTVAADGGPLPHGGPVLDGKGLVGHKRESIGRRSTGGNFPCRLLVTDSPVGHERMFIATVEDLTRARRAEKAFQENTAKYRSLFEDAGDGIFIIDAGTRRFLSVNHTACERLGYDRDELLQMGPADIADPEHGTDIRLVFEVLEELGSHTFEHAHRTRDGATMFVEITTSTIEWDGRPAYQSVVRDISARRQAEHDRDDARRLVVDVMRSLSAQIAVLDADGTILMVNQAWQDFGLANGAPPDEAVCGTGGNYFQVCERAAADGDPDAGVVLAGFKDVLAGRRAGFSYQYPCSRPGGPPRHFRLHAEPLVSLRPGLVVSHTDITARVEAEEARSVSDYRAARAEVEARAAEEASQQKSSFLNTVSHELRTPMTAVLGLAEQAAEQMDEGEPELARRFLGRIIVNAERQTALINDILDLARIETGRMEYTWERQSLKDIVCSVTDELRPVAERRQLTIGIYDAAGPTLARCDALKMSRVVQNLLGNALKFATPGSEIEVRLARDGTEQSVAVVNRGHAIPEDELSAIFEPFRQSSVSDDGSGGSGLGLALCETIVADHGGRIWAASDAAGTVTFTFTIPTEEGDGTSAHG